MQNAIVKDCIPHDRLNGEGPTFAFTPRPGTVSDGTCLARSATGSGRDEMLRMLTVVRMKS